ncbi:hypothetical protein O181_056289 [Austropuccinia psidii MF-1]|uniref:Uncharacterized protein n=1 Tax=Austropuccinia psidii MF-1 TaxID=1389203 RepID=A0A9Q3E8A6_9BASI|nr:hypothetical protein [Austropuccinia psidii MF-1]
MSRGLQSFSHSPRSVPTNFDVISEPELIEGNVLRSEPFPSGSNRNISVPIQKLAQSSKRRGVGNMPKPLAGGQELLYTHQERTIELSGQWIPLFFKDKVKRINNWLNSQRLLFIDQKKQLEMSPALEKEGPLASAISKPAPEVSKDKPKGPQKK